MGQESFSNAVDKALLKLSKDFGITLPRDDYVLVQLFLNKEILGNTINDEISRIRTENNRYSAFFREALANLAKQHNQQYRFYKKLLIGCVCCTAISTIIAMTSIAMLWKGILG